MLGRRRAPSDPDLPALTLVIYPALRDSIEVAGAIRSGVLKGLSGENGTADMRRMFEAARSAVPADGGLSSRSFGDMVDAASEAATDPVAWFVHEIVCQNVLEVMCDIPAAASNRAAADAFSGTFVNAAARLARGTLSDAPLETRMDHVEILNRIRRSALIYPADMPMDPAEFEADMEAVSGDLSAIRSKMRHMAGKELGDAAYRSAFNAASRITYRTVSPDEPGTALHAAVAATFEAAVLDVPGTAFRNAAKDVCRKMSRMACRVDGVRDEAVKRLSNELLAATADCPDGQSAAEVAARLAPEAVKKMSADSVCVETFRAVYGILVGGAYRTATDRSRFGSIYEEALEATNRMDSRTYPGISAYDYPSDDFGPENDIDAMATRIWLQCFAAANRSVGDWMKEAARVDYRAEAESPKNAGLMRLYEATYDAAHQAAVREASSIVLEGGRGSQNGI